MNEESQFAADRERMVAEQLASRDVRSPRVLEAMRQVPRHVFVPPEHWHLAYADGPLPIGSGQTISQPYIVALMTQLLELAGQEKVLEIGTGSGYQAAILGALAREVHTIERHEPLARVAARLLSDLGFVNVFVHVGDGSRGLPEQAPYDAILVTAAAPQVPAALLEQLGEGGRLVIPVGERGGQYLERWRLREGKFMPETIAPVAFVPLLGEFGWEEE
jgi:protein-L-isoaspartate(D-aspartate) O-methyltransferase